MYYAYVIESLGDPGRLYRGSARDVEMRLARHNAGKCKHTAKYCPWKLKLSVAFEAKALAQRFERYLKSGSGHAFANRHFWD
jgi:putative endonuclease